MSSIENRGIWTDLIKGVGLQMAEVFDQGQEEYKPGIGSVLRTATGEGAELNYTGKTGAGEVQRYDDGDDMPGGRRHKTYTTRVAFNNYGKYIEVTKNTIDDRDFASELSEMKDLGVAVNYSQDRSGMQIFNGGFATTADVNGYRMSWYGDAKPLFSTIHPSTVPGQSTQSNASATGITFTHDNLETGMLAHLLQKTDDGIPLEQGGKPVVVLPPALMREGMETLNSQLDPTSANNAINVYNQGMGADMATSLFLASTNGGSDTAWYLTIPSRAKLMHIVREAPNMDQDVNIKNGVLTYTVAARWADAALEWKRTWGSKGDGASYSS